MRCHADEGEQWKTTSHSLAWQTLVDAKKDATPECIACHVVGYKQPGGFQTGADDAAARRTSSARTATAWAPSTRRSRPAPHRITEQTCITCHQGENDPEFNCEKKLPKIAHSNLSGETIKNKKNKTGARRMMKSSGSH